MMKEQSRVQEAAFTLLQRLQTSESLYGDNSFLILITFVVPILQICNYADVLAIDANHFQTSCFYIVLYQRHLKSQRKLVSISFPPLYVSEAENYLFCSRAVSEAKLGIVSQLGLSNLRQAICIYISIASFLSSHIA